jgi:hypothetical protein
MKPRENDTTVIASRMSLRARTNESGLAHYPCAFETIGASPLGKGVALKSTINVFFLPENICCP